VIDSVKFSDIGDWVRVDEDESEMTGVENLIRPCGKETSLTCSLKFLISVDRFFILILLPLAGFARLRLFRCLSLLHEVEVVLQLLAPAEFFEHGHFILAVVIRTGKDLLFLSLLSHVYNTRPILLILGSEVAEEFVKRLIPLSHRLDRVC